jgi:hypothetical protein
MSVISVTLLLELNATRKDVVVFWDAYGDFFNADVPTLIAEQLIAEAKATIKVRYRKSERPHRALWPMSDMAMLKQLSSRSCYPDVPSEVPFATRSYSSARPYRPQLECILFTITTDRPIGTPSF